LTAAIVVNDRLIAPATKNHAAVWQPRSSDELRNLTTLAQAAVGFDTTRGDVVTVEDLAFDGNQGQPPVAMPQQILNSAESSPVLVKYIALSFGLIVVIFFAVRPAIRRASTALTVRSPQKAGSRELASSASQAVLSSPEPAPIDPERLRNQEIYEQVRGHLKREPTQSSRLLQSWIHSE
jgi:flagellar M-ring protein FliF